MGRPTTDELELGRVAARQVAAELDHLGLLERLRRAGALDERLRIARDLHDGVLQGLAAAGMKLQAAVGTLDAASPEALARVHEVQQILADEQRELRAISRELKPSAAPSGTERDLAGRLREVCSRVSAQWDLAVDFHSPEPVPHVAAKLAQEACHLLHEALVNAARHGHARAARVELTPGAPGLRLVVEDDGEGFSFQGTYELEELASRKIGPLALRERVASLGGTLRLVSRREGTRLEIGLSLAAERI
jgi:signal transduction histidine kinase